MPVDGSANEDGLFPCGRQETAFEGKEFKLPTSLECDECIVALEWQTEKGIQHRCSDFLSVGKEIPECFGTCLNGGICANGVCACPPYFSGKNCQDEDPDRSVGTAPAGKSVLESIGEESWILFVYLVMLLLIAGFFIGAYFLYK